MADNWYEDHDQWLAQFNELVNEALNVDPETPFRDDADEMAMSDIAAKLTNGKIDLPEAIRRTMEWIVGRIGVKWIRDQETFDLEMAVGGLIDCTDEVKINLLTAGEVGIADGIKQLYADPRLLITGPGDIAQIDDLPTIGVHSKGWLELGKLSPTEAANLHWAVAQALKAKLSE